MLALTMSLLLVVALAFTSARVIHWRDRFAFASENARALDNQLAASRRDVKQLDEALQRRDQRIAFHQMRVQFLEAQTKGAPVSLLKPREFNCFIDDAEANCIANEVAGGGYRLGRTNYDMEDVLGRLSRPEEVQFAALLGHLLKADPAGHNFVDGLGEDDRMLQRLFHMAAIATSINDLLTPHLEDLACDVARELRDERRAEAIADLGQRAVITMEHHHALTH